jgi:hypothetical protein
MAQFSESISMFSSQSRFYSNEMLDKGVYISEMGIENMKACVTGLTFSEYES